MTQPIVSIDAHKDSCTYVVKNGDEIVVEATRISSTTSSLRELAREHPDALFLMEASGAHEWIYDLLLEEGVDVFIGHPITREASDRGKSDGKDCKRFAARHQVGDVKEVHVAPPEVRRLRDLVRTRTRLKGDKTRFTNRIRGALTRWGYYAEENPDPFGPEGRAQVVEVHPELEPLYELAEQAEAHVDRLESEVRQEARGIEAVERLQSIPGVGALTALALHVEIQQIDRFPNAQALVSYFGLDPVVEQSGDDRWHVHTISKKGRAYIRGLLTQAAWVHVSRAEASSLTATYHRLRKRKGKQIAIVATARRLLKVAYHVLDEDRMFEMTPPAMA